MKKFGAYPIDRPLSSREMEIIGLMAEGYSNRDIAKKLILSPETIKWYNKQIYNKLGVNSRTQAVASARTNRLLVDHPSSSHPSSQKIYYKLPIDVSSFVGREGEVTAIIHLIHKARLVTLTGSGGVGKTRLAVHVAHESVKSFSNGVCFISLAAISDSKHVPNVIGQELGIVESPNQPMLKAVQYFLSKRPVLLVLDNFEHLMDAAPLIVNLLANTPNLTILVTSREVLKVSGEHEYRVPPLTTPNTLQVKSTVEMSNYEAVRLFNQRAQAIFPGFRLTDENIPIVADICKRLDGLPLAIELAVARLNFLGLQQLHNRLENRLNLLQGYRRDSPLRQQSLRHTIEWSFNLLNEHEQRLFSWLGVFSNGRSLDAVSTICGPGLNINPLNGLESILNKSLIYQIEGPDGDPRFYMLETLQEYALEQLTTNDELVLIRNRHLDYFSSLVAEMSPGYKQHNQIHLLERTDIEKGNLFAALDWAIEDRQYEIAANMLSSLEFYFCYRELYVEGYRWSKRILEELKHISLEGQARLLLTLGNLAYYNGELETSQEHCQKALRLAEQLGNKHCEAKALVLLGGPWRDFSETYQVSVASVKKGLLIFQNLNDQSSIAYALNLLGELYRYGRDYEIAKKIYEQALVIVHKTGDSIRENMLRGNLSYIAYQEKDYERAAEISFHNVKQAYDLGLQHRTQTALVELAGPLSQLGEKEKAVRLLSSSAALTNKMAIDYLLTDQVAGNMYKSNIRNQLDAVSFDSAWKEGQQMTLAEAVAYALDETDLQR